eukprot:1252813-Amphidinium_carterae.1
MMTTSVFEQASPVLRGLLVLLKACSPARVRCTTVPVWSAARGDSLLTHDYMPELHAQTVCIYRSPIASPHTAGLLHCVDGVVVWTRDHQIWVDAGVGRAGLC